MHEPKLRLFLETESKEAQIMSYVSPIPKSTGGEASQTILMKTNKKMIKGVKIIDCECDGPWCCGGRGIAVFSVEREGKKIKVCTKCDLQSDKNKKILPYVSTIPASKLMEFDALGALCLAFELKDRTLATKSKAKKRA